MKRIVLAGLLLLTVILYSCTLEKPGSTGISSERKVRAPLEEDSLPEKKSTTLFIADDKTGKGVPLETTATLHTDKGNIVLLLSLKDAPLTVANFISKVKEGYYDGLAFHRVEDWVIQGGDPLGNGTGGGEIKTELSDRVFKEGSLGVARGGDIEVSNDSQFFICKKDCEFLNKKYTYFGKVISGMEVVKKIEVGDIISTADVK